MWTPLLLARLAANPRPASGGARRMSAPMQSRQTGPQTEQWCRPAKRTNPLDVWQPQLLIGQRRTSTLTGPLLRLTVVTHRDETVARTWRRPPAATGRVGPVSCVDALSVRDASDRFRATQIGSLDGGACGGATRLGSFPSDRGVRPLDVDVWVGRGIPGTEPSTCARQ